VHLAADQLLREALLARRALCGRWSLLALSNGECAAQVAPAGLCIHGMGTGGAPSESSCKCLRGRSDVEGSKK
jgi:hypothetical protein